MATIVDALVVTLGLDTKELQRGAEEAKKIIKELGQAADKVNEKPAVAAIKQDHAALADFKKKQREAVTLAKKQQQHVIAAHRQQQAAHLLQQQKKPPGYPPGYGAMVRGDTHPSTALFRQAQKEELAAFCHGQAKKIALLKTEQATALQGYKERQQQSRASVLGKKTGLDSNSNSNSKSNSKAVPEFSYPALTRLPQRWREESPKQAPKQAKKECQSEKNGKTTLSEPECAPALQPPLKLTALKEGEGGESRESKHSLPSTNYFINDAKEKSRALSRLPVQILERNAAATSRNPARAEPTKRFVQHPENAAKNLLRAEKNFSAEQAKDDTKPPPPLSSLRITTINPGQNIAASLEKTTHRHNDLMQTAAACLLATMRLGMPIRSMPIRSMPIKNMPRTSIPAKIIPPRKYPSENAAKETSRHSREWPVVNRSTQSEKNEKIEKNHLQATTSLGHAPLSIDEKSAQSAAGRKSGKNNFYLQSAMAKTVAATLPVSAPPFLPDVYTGAHAAMRSGRALMQERNTTQVETKIENIIINAPQAKTNTDVAHAISDRLKHYVFSSHSNKGLT